MTSNITIATSPLVANMETNFIGRKVVAMPPVELLKKHHYPIHTPTRSPGKEKNRGVPRPKSPARTPASRSRDIVQEVYDRMGVNFVRGRSSIELDDSKSVISIHSVTKNVTKSPSRRRSDMSRSSTGSSVVQLRGTSTEEAEGSIRGRCRSVSSQGYAGARRPPPGSADQSNEGNATEKKHPVVALSTSPRKRDSDDNNHSSSSFHTRREFAWNESRDESNERRDGDGDDDIDGRQSPVSVKSRISAFSGYGGPKSATNANGRNYSQSPSKNFTLRNGLDCPKSRDSKFMTDPKKSLHPSVASTHNLLHQTVTTIEDRNDRNAIMSTISMDESHGLGHTSHTRTISDSLSRAERKGGIANSFLDAIASSSKFSDSLQERRHVSSNKRIPFEIRPIQHSDVDNDDDHSIAASSVSGGDFTAGVSKAETPGRKHRQSGSTVASFAKRYEASSRSGPKDHSSSTLSAATVSRLIEEQVEAKFAFLKGVLGAEIRRVEEQTKTRLDGLELKIDTLLKQAPIDGMKDQQQTQPTASRHVKGTPATRGRTYYRSHG
jgi:hypothetical protein